mgnify:FL=1
MAASHAGVRAKDSFWSRDHSMEVVAVVSVATIVHFVRPLLCWKFGALQQEAARLSRAFEYRIQRPYSQKSSSLLALAASVA